MKFEFEDIKFIDKKDYVEGVFLSNYSLKLNIKKLGKYSVKDGILEIEMSEKKSNRFYNLLDEAFENLTNKLNGKKTVYIHKNSGIPLIGSVAFGIIDRGTNIIEIKPVTSCNLDCVYCSINLKKRPVDFIVEADYVVEELNKILEYKNYNNMEIHIGCQGEPLRYSKLAYLIKEICKNESVKRVSMDTNATMLTKSKVDDLIKSGMTRFNISLNALDEKLAKKIAGAEYNLKHVLDIIDYISKKNVELVIAPVWVPSINDDEMEKIVKKYHKIAKIIGIQKYLKYKFGKILKEITWDEFYTKLEQLGKKYDKKLILDETDFDIIKTKMLEKPFKKGEVIDANIICDNNVANEKIAIAKNRVITIRTDKTGKSKIKITRTKHNIFYGELIN